MTDGGIEARLSALEAQVAIQRMHHRYMRRLADREFDRLIESFVDDAVIDMRTHGPKHGREAIIEHFSHMVTVPLGGASYFVSAPIIEVDGGHASGIWTWHRLHSEALVGGTTVTNWGVWEEGRYDCEYRNTPTGWLFSAMRFRMVRPVPD